VKPIVSRNLILLIPINLIVAVLVVWGSGEGSARAAVNPAGAVSRPNVLLIAIDDLNDWVGCLGGHPQARTPNIDALAQQGMLFTNAHCQGPICGPSRASLLSGCYPHTTGLYQQPRRKLMEADSKNFRGHLLPEYFAENGYSTYAVGKITHGYRPETAFQHYGGKFAGSGPKPENGFRFNFHPPDVPWTGTQTDWGAFPDTVDRMPDFKSASYAEKILSQKHDAPFFLAVGFNRPHVPFYVPQKWLDLFPIESIQLPRIQKNDLDDVPLISRQIHELPKYPNLEFLQANDNRQFRKCVQAYLACTAFVDGQVGRVLMALEDSDYASNTLVVLFSDHGYHLGEKDRVSKHSLWEESTRVPLIIVPPRTQRSPFKPGQLCDRPVELIDLYPTAVELCGLPAKSGNEGYSLQPLLQDPKSEWRFAALTTYARGNHALRSQRYRFIQYEDGSEELYDHEFDPEEWVNLAEEPEYQELLTRFRLELPANNAAYHPSTQAGAINAWFAEHLKSNGVQ
jgi:arylsulfatase A-like enzyme